MRIALSPRSLRAVVTVVSLLSAAAPALAQAPPPALAAPLKVMSFNIRLGTAADGEDHWTRRREMLFELLKEQDADLVGLQEAFRWQVDEILAAVPIYAVAGVGRDDAKGAGEMSCILFRRDRLAVAESGTFWFSDTPAVPGSRTWGNRITRISTWARFVDRDGTAFYHYNLHLDHQAQVSREKSTELLLARILTRSFPTEAVIVTGDFNAGEANPALHRLTGPPGVKTTVPAPFVDTFRVLHPDEPVVGTFTGFKFGQVNGDKIDYVLVQPGTTVLDAGIIRASREGHYPSDHFPVSATVRLPIPAVPEPAAAPAGAPQSAPLPTAPGPAQPPPAPPPPPAR